MAVAFDSVGPSSAGTGHTGTAALSWTHTTVGALTTVYVGAEVDNVGDGTLATCTLDSVSMVSIGIIRCQNPQNAGYCQVFRLAGIASGAHSIVLTYNAVAADAAAGSIALTGAGAEGTVVTSSNAGTLAVSPTTSGGMVLGFVAAGDSINATTSPSASRYVDNLMGATGHDAGNIAGATSPSTGSSVTMAWTLNSANSGGIVAFEVQAAPPAVVPPPPPALLYAPGWFPGSQAVTVDPGGIPFYAEPHPTDEAPAVIFPPTPEADPVRPVPPGWFPGADNVTAVPDGIPFTQAPPPLNATPPVIFPVPEVAGIADWLPLPPGWFPGASQVTTDPGSIPFYSLPQPLTPPPAPSPSPFAFLHGTAGTGTGQYFTDQNGQPYLLRWDTVWNLIVNAGNSGGATTWQSDMDGYCAARAAEGFNGFLTTPVATSSAIPGAPFVNGNTWDGVAPFSSPGALNGVFWARVDYLLNSAQASGLTVVMNVGYTYSLFDTGAPLNAWTTGQFQSYGAAVGARYSSVPNLIWEVGDDYGGSWDGGLNGFDAQFNAFLTGLRSSGAAQMISVENMSEGSSRYPIDLAQTYAWGVANAQFDWIYSYDVAYTAIENAYGEAAAKSVPNLAVVKMDGWYDNQYNGGTLTESVELFARKWIWWTLSAGSRGAMYGQNELYQWPVNALSSGLASASPGSQYMQPAALNLAWNTLASFTGWHLLVPDTTSALVTAGRGTRSNGAFGTGAGTAGPTSMYLGGNTYVTASINAAGTLAVIYIPNAASAVTVNGSLMVAGYTATWVDPASGAQTRTSVASTYAHAAANSAGDADWLLVLQAPGLPAIPAATAPVPQLAPGWFPGSHAVTTQPGGIPFSVPAVPDPGAPPAAASASPVAGLATGTGSAQQALAAIGANAAVATGTGTSQAPVAALGVNAAAATGTGTAQAAVAALGVNAGLATGTGAAQQPTVQTSGTTNAPATVATGTGTAQSPLAAIGANAAAATGTGTAQAPLAATGANAAAATGTGTAQGALAAIAVNAGLAAATGAAPNATVQTSGGINVNAGLAAATGTAQPPVAATGVHAAAATGTGTAQAATGQASRSAVAGLASATGAAQAPTLTLAALANAAAATALGAALNATGNAVEPFTVGTLTTGQAVPTATLTTGISP